MSSPARRLGILLQGVVLALFLAAAILVMLSFDETAAIFRYQGF